MVLHTRSVASTLSLAVLLSIAHSSAAPAQAPNAVAPGAYCVLSLEEVAELAGFEDPIVISSGDEWCRYEAGSDASLDLALNYEFLEAVAAARPEDGQLVMGIDGYPGWYGRGPGEEGGSLAVETGRIRLDVRLDPATGDPSVESIRPIAEVAIPRLVRMLEGPQDPLTDAEMARDELVAMFPSELGGERLDVTGQTSDEVFATGFPNELRDTLEGILSVQGGMIEDLSVALANLDSGGSISAFRVTDVAAADLAEPLVKALFGGQVELDVTPATLAGKDVLALTAPSGVGTAYAYAAGDVVWFIAMDEALTIEALNALP